MKILVLGATGATGRLVVQQLINRNHKLKIVIRRDTGEFKEMLVCGSAEIIVGNISEYGIDDFAEILNDCDATVSCLGHNITLKGIFGKPRMLVSDCVSKVCLAINKSRKNNFRFVLLNSTACRNIRANEKYSLVDRMILRILSFLLPPQKDNERAAKILSKNTYENNSKIEWIALRPDTLINEADVSGYHVKESPYRSPVVDAGKTSRINVGHFIAELLSGEELWNEWKYKMPVIYNSGK